MKSRDQIERELCRIILDACQAEQDATGEFMCPADVLADLRAPERVTADAARRVVGITDRTWDAEHRRFFVVHEITSGVRPRSRRAAKSSTF